MARYKLSTLEKKNVIETETWVNDDGLTFTIENGWRWGEFYYEFDEAPDIDLSNPDGLDTWEIGDVEDHDLDDGCWTFFNFPDDFPEDLKQQVEETWEESWSEGLENLGFYHEDTETILKGPLALEKIDD